MPRSEPHPSRAPPAASAPCTGPGRRARGLPCPTAPPPRSLRENADLPRAGHFFQGPATPLASLHFDSGQFPSSFSTEFQNQGVKLQETSTTQIRPRWPQPTGGHPSPALSATPTPHFEGPLALVRPSLWALPPPQAISTSLGTLSRLRRCPTLMNVMPSCWPMR